MSPATPENESVATGKELETADPRTLQALSSLVPRISDQELREIGSYEDAVALAERVHQSVIDIAEELGSGFIVLEDKDKLIDNEFVLITWKFNAGDFGQQGFTSAGLVTKGGDKFIINDGGSGIHAQLMELSHMHGRFGGVKVPRGLRKSDYTTCPECGKPMSRDEVECSNTLCTFSGDKRSTGVTYYLDLTPRTT